MTETIIDDRGDEFMRINGRYSGQAYRYVYGAHWGNDVTFGPAMKHDMQRQTTEVHDYGRDRMTSEPVFVRKRGATAEDEGWVMSYVYDPERDLSDASSSMPRTSSGSRSRRSVCPFACRTVFTEAGRPTGLPSSSRTAEIAARFESNGAADRVSFATIAA